MRWSVILAALACLSVAAQQEYRLRVTVNLVQVDASVTDAQGNPVSGLSAADFRLLLDGKPQELKYCNYVRLSEAPAVKAPSPETMAPSAAKPAMPAQSIQREDVRRTIVLFVGDLLTSSESIPSIRTGLTKFVEEQVRPGDLVAIVRSSAGLGALQDFTTDKRMLLAAIDQVRWTTHALGTGGASAYEAIGQPGLGGILSMDIAQLDKIDSIERATLETTFSLLKVVRSMADLPGRKSLVFLSDGLRLASPDEMDPGGNTAVGTGAFLSPIYASMRRVVDESVRAGVVLYAIDTRGQSSLLAGAADRLKPAGADGGGGRGAPVSAPPPGDWVRTATDGRRADYRDNQWGALFISSQTGGFMITESNRIAASLERVMADQRGYYLLGFQPPGDAMHPDFTGTPDYHQLKIEVLRPGLKVRSHAGFFGVGDEDRTASAPELQLSNSFQNSGIKLDVDASFLAEKNGSFLRATVYIDGHDVSFQGPPIHRTGVLHLIVRAFNAKGETLPGGIDQMRRIDLNEEGYQRALNYGLIYTARLPAPKAGPYQVRVACRDESTGKVGTGGDFVSIPQPKGNGVRLSGIIFQHDLGTDDHVIPASGPDVYAAGQTVRFAFQILPAATAGVERLETQTRLFRDGIEVWKSAPTPVANLTVASSLEVPPGLGPGKYLLRVDIAGKAQSDTPIAWQWARLRLR